MDAQILVCDDDPEIRAAMRRTLYRYQVTAVGDAEAALRVLRRHPFHAVISDFDLGGTDGLELLQMVRLLYPDTLRCLVTGNGDVQIAIRAVNEGAVHRYFLKPWDDEQLIGAIEIAMRTVERTDVIEVVRS
jgi:DNA-binding NtrC family response regulator